MLEGLKQRLCEFGRVCAGGAFRFDKKKIPGRRSRSEDDDEAVAVMEALTCAACRAGFGEYVVRLERACGAATRSERHALFDLRVMCGDDVRVGDGDAGWRDRPARGEADEIFSGGVCRRRGESEDRRGAVKE